MSAADGSTRVDRWIWAIRLYSTRGDATEACRGGHVRVNGKPAKAATLVRAGDRVMVRVRGTERDVEVVEVIDKRVGAAIAVTCYVDHTPVIEADDTPRVASRERGAGRPTKRDRRRLDDWRSGRG